MMTIVILTMVTFGVVRIIQDGKVLRYVNEANQDIAQMQEYIF
jgi:hypothetical protein